MSFKGKAVWKIHHWAGLYAGIVIAVLSITGAIAVFIPEIDHWLHADIYEVPPPAAGENMMQGANAIGAAIPLCPPLAEQRNLGIEVSPLTRGIQKVLEQSPSYRLIGLEIPAKEGEAYVMDMLRPGNNKLDLGRKQLYIDPYRGSVAGVSDGFNSVANFMRQIHVRLYDSLYGRQIVGLAGIALLISCITGLMIYGSFMKRQRFGTIRRGRNIRIVNADWHKLIGIVSLVFNLVIAITGAWLGLQPRLMNWFSMQSPGTYTASEQRFEKDIDRILVPDIQQVLLIVKKEFPDLQPTRMVLSADGSGTVRVEGNIEGAVYERNSSNIVLAKQSGEVLFKYDVRNSSFADKLYFVQEALHFGDFGGLLLKIVYFIFGLTTGFLSVTGFIIYLYRKEKNKQLPSVTMKRVFIWSAALLLGLLLILLGTLLVGYQVMTAIITPLVYVFLGLLILYYIVRAFNKRFTDRSTKERLPQREEFFH